MQRSVENENLLIAFDLGGTWFRSALVARDGVRDIRRTQAVGRRALPDASIDELQQQLLHYLLDEVAARRAEHRPATVTVGISLGAAIHGTSGLVLASAPLWGPGAAPFDLICQLRAAAPDAFWFVINDVSAAAIAFAELPWAEGSKKIAALTLSTGIALRTVEVGSGRIATDHRHGMQGEIGHIPVDVTVREQRLSLECDCGAHDHLSSFLSGRGIPQVLAAANYDQGAKDPTEAFAAAVCVNEPEALGLLDAITRPLARILLDLAVLDPECGIVVLYGGVASAIGEPLRESIVRNLNLLEMYGVTDSDPGFFERRIRLEIGQSYCLLGAARAAVRHRATVSEGPGERRWRVATEQHISYEVALTTDVLDPTNEALAAAIAPRSAPVEHVVVVDRAVAHRHGERIREYFDAHSLEAKLIELDGGESTKSIEEVMRLVREFSAAGVPRRDVPIVAIGGGVTLDVVGLSASLFRRGTPYIRLPTTLIALIDAGIGVKTAVNFDGHKSRIGTYHASNMTLLDTTFLETLERRQIGNGLAEVVKIALVKDRELFDLVESHAQSVMDDAANAVAITTIVQRSVNAMLDELSGNLWEHCLERLPDHGHSFSPAIEMHAQPHLLHGEAVAIDIAVGSLLARNRGLLSSDDADRVLMVLKSCELPCWHDVCTPEMLVEALVEIARHRGGYQRIPLMTGIGSATFVSDIDFAEIAAAADELAARASGRI